MLPRHFATRLFIFAFAGRARPRNCLMGHYFFAGHDAAWLSPARQLMERGAAAAYYRTPLADDLLRH